MTTASVARRASTRWTARRGRGHVACNPAPHMMDHEHIRSRIVGINIPPGERLASGLVGGVLAVAGLRRHSLGGLAVAGVGAALMLRAVVGRCAAYRVRAIRRGIHVRRVITIQCAPREVYDLCRDLTNLPRFMHHLESVTLEDAGISRWVIKEGPTRLAYRAEIVEDTPGRRLRWRSLPGGDLAHEGELDFRVAPADRGTEVVIKLHYFPPGGLVVASTLYALLRWLARTQLGMELVRLRQLIETGELATGARRREELAPTERRAADERRRHPRVRAAIATAGASTWAVVTGPAGAR